MKWKTVLVFCIIFLFVFMIYLTTLDRKVFYLNLGDEMAEGDASYGSQLKDYFQSLSKLERYIDQFNDDDLRITDLIRAIETNQKVKVGDKEQTIKNALIKADLVTLSVGRNDFVYKIDYMSKSELYDTADEVLNDMEELFVLLREYCKEDIMVLGIINSNWPSQEEVFTYLNQKLSDLCEEYDLIFYLPEHVEVIDGHPTPESETILFEGFQQLVDENLFK